MIRFLLGAAAGAASVYVYAIFMSYTRESESVTEGGVTVYVSQIPPDTTARAGAFRVH